MERWQRALDDVRGDELRGSIHLSAPVDTSYQVLEPIALKLCAAHPKLRVVLDTSDVVQHLHRDAIDLAIRYGPMQDSSLQARRLSESPGILVASPQYLREHGVPGHPDELSDHRCLTLQRANVPSVSWQLWRGEEAFTVRIESPLCGDGYLARRWAIAGMGIAYKTLFDVIEDLEEGRLVRVLPDISGGPIPVHVVFPSRQFLPRCVRVLDESIANAFAARQARCDAWLRDANH